ncbi:succinate-CoA ligase [Dictyostelium discoideum AX4]|uniref:Succinate--CoA ligase [GDP-forming] subunit beta, mitochondrial n=1 Tax=Dictyostelium discoideum TaxID=44689 RepID=SUCB2_DICDI|nr:succinate-CoA ligase [Dictyostelium discoideum AX4]Q869S7.1 RecName: Full=Succinate--CoA ligase [GDP-forming] subunit beta, mitochondrial; AltName: Full=GTP-specific succinyl-CoA synthetase subunit beta; Short=G-SCS; Short=GTPSCS; AltName: Full=Succinyl-CoA synthetase beta-G chain; Short=SCS-betaG [Dictyostelium discoideum]EAL70117.1 succinate-CoA ligase [Dictyostelium discoideum AX4]|eukprot:XP_644183.1 succinate-CoA ligase [Dictyostelium discoideum AX4]
MSLFNSANKVIGGVLKFNPSKYQVRYLNLHEYQSKSLMDKYGVNTQKWRVVTKASDAIKAASELNGELVVKAQVHAGGRGKGSFIETGFKGGVHLCKTGKEAERLCDEMLGKHLVTKQTTKEGTKVQSVMLAESVDPKRELYFAIVMDRKYGGPVMIASPQGGVDIESVAEETPDLIFKEPIDIVKGIRPEQTKNLAEKLGFTGEKAKIAQQQMENLYQLFIKSDATQVEINPFAETTDGQVICMDAKINFDDNASFRQKEIFEMRDTAEEDPREVEAGKFGLNYIGLDGNIGCMVNGAGLAMATMDIIKLKGGIPANFLDVGGSASEQAVTEAFKILTKDPRVKCLLVNIFGGIMKCDIIASGIVNASKQVGLKIPLVVRLEGTNVNIGKEILEKSGLNITSASDLDDAAIKAVNCLKK